jgi:hypothetical protein
VNVHLHGAPLCLAKLAHPVFFFNPRFTLTL